MDGVATPAPAPPVNDCEGLYTSTSDVTFGTDSTFVGRIIQRYECPRSTFTSTARLEGGYSVTVENAIIMRVSGTGDVDEAWAAPGAVSIVWRKDDTVPFDTLAFAIQ